MIDREVGTFEWVIWVIIAVLIGSFFVFTIIELDKESKTRRISQCTSEASALNLPSHYDYERGCMVQINGQWESIRDTQEYGDK